MEHERRYDLEKKFRDELGSKYDADGKFKEGFEFALKLFIAMEDEREKHSEEIVSMLMEESNKVHTCTPNERAFLDEIREKGKLVKSKEGVYYISFPQGYIDQSDFTKTNLSELVEGKG